MLNQYFMNKGLIQQRTKGYEDVARVRGEEARLTEDRQFQNDMKILSEEFTRKVSEMPPIDSLRTQIQYKRQVGQPTSDLEADLKAEIGKVAQGLTSTVQGDLNPEDVGYVIGGMTEDAYTKMMEQGAQSYRKEEQISRVDEPDQRLKEKQYEQDWARIELDKRELDLKAQDNLIEIGKLNREDDKAYREGMTKMINDIRSHLEKEGVKGEEGMGSYYMVESKTRDPLSSELRGRTYAFLNNALMKLHKGMALTPDEELIISRAQSSYQLRQNPDTIPTLDQTTQRHGPQATSIYEATLQRLNELRPDWSEELRREYAAFAAQNAYNDMMKAKEGKQ